MQKQINYLALLCLGTIICLSGFLNRALAQTATAPSVGDGSSGSPYQIETWDNLYWISQNSGEWSKYYIQTADIDLSTADPAITAWDGGAGWTPIGNPTTKFTGSYDGQGHIINGVYINRTGGSYQGLFGYADGVTIQRLGVTNVSITANTSPNGCVGALAGLILSSTTAFTINNCYSTGSVGTSTIGVYFCCDFGGLIGRMDGQSHSSSAVNNCYSKVNVSVSGTYADNAGGFVGTYGNSHLNNVYSTGSVICTGNYKGGLASYSFGGVSSNSFWDTQTSGQSSSATGVGKTTAEMKTYATFFDAGWDLMVETTNGTNDYWGMNGSDNNGYPFLSWQGIHPMCFLPLPHKPLRVLQVQQLPEMVPLPI